MSDVMDEDDEHPEKEAVEQVWSALVRRILLPTITHSFLSTYHGYIAGKLFFCV